MKASLRWLRELVDLPDDPDAVADAFNSLGHEVESIELIEPQMSGVVVARVEEVMAHPNADKVRLARVTTGSEESTVVCGAWNFDAGATVALAPPGARLAGGFEVGEKEIRGVTSPGMICSARELGLGDEHEGILVLHPGTELGADVAELVGLPDVIYDLSITTNRPDAMGMVGLARDLAAKFETELRLPDTTIPRTSGDRAAMVSIEDPAGCPRFTARVVEDVAIGPSPLWMHVRLASLGVRPINNVVDVSNYVMMELGHPTHTFDLDRLGSEVVIRRARDGESLTTLDGVERSLLPSDLVVADGSDAAAIAGVMGGEHSEVHADTTNVLVEVAYFDPTSVMLTSKRHSLRSEASARFERGMDPEQPPASNARVCRLLAEVAGGTVSTVLVDEYPAPVSPLQLELDVGRAGRVLSLDIDAPEATRILRALDFDVTGDGPLHVTVPTRRPDVERNVDLLEELARLYGYERIPESIARGPGGGLPVWAAQLRRIRAVMVGVGYHEALTLPFVSETDLERLGMQPDDLVTMTNPLYDSEPILRPSMLPGLLSAAQRNHNYGTSGVALFEVGLTFHSRGDELPEQPTRLGFVRTEHAGRTDTLDVYDATGLWATLAAALASEDWTLEPVADAPFHPTRAAAVMLGERRLGTVGEAHPRVSAGLDLTGRVILGEIDLEPFLSEVGEWEWQAPSEFPPLGFDIAFELPDQVPAGSVLRAVSGASPLVESVHIFDVFAGDPLPAGHKSIALRVTLRSPDQTLSDEDGAAARAAMADAVAELGGTLRGNA